MEKKRFYIDTMGNDDEAYREAMQYACKLAEEDSEIRTVILLIGSKSNTGWFERILGGETVKHLFKGMKFNNCIPLFKFETLKTYKDGYAASEVVIACGLNSEDIFKFDDFYSCKAMISIPWLRERTEKWIKTWNPVELRGKENASTAYEMPSVCAQRAFKELTHSINMSTGISHPADNDLAKRYILSLHKYEGLNADVIKAYLIRDLGWDSENANDIEKLIITLNEGRHFQGGSRTGLKSYYNGWKTEE